MALLAVLTWTAAATGSGARSEDYHDHKWHRWDQLDTYAGFGSQGFPRHGTAVVTAAADLVDPGCATVPIYRVVIAESNLAWAQGLADLFGIGGDPEWKSRTLVRFVDGHSRRSPKLVAFPLVGAFRSYMWSDPPVPGERPLLPTDEAAVATAIGFLTARDLMPQDVANVATVTGYGAPKNEGEESFPVCVSVSFQRAMAGLAIVGPGQQMEVTVAEGGVAAVVHIWPELEFYEDVPAKPLDAALADLQAGLHATAWQHPPEVTRMQVRKAELKLWIGDHEYMQRFASPVYEVSGVYLNADGSVVEPFVEYCDAAA